MVSFSGNKLKWTKYLDSFETAVRSNDKLSNTEKLNYSKSNVSCKSRSAILELTLSYDIYTVAVGILKERFGKSQEVIDLHDTKMINLHSALNNTSSLRNLLDTIDRHICSLDVFKQNTNQEIFVSIIWSKLPKEVLIQLEMLKGAHKKWTVESLCGKLYEYVTAPEHAKKKVYQVDTKSKKDNKFRLLTNSRKKHRIDHNTIFRPNTNVKQNYLGGARKSIGSAEVLVANTKQTSTTRFYNHFKSGTSGTGAMSARNIVQSVKENHNLKIPAINA